jgi:hypothetical protein
MRWQRPGPGKLLDREVRIDFCFDGTGSRRWGVYRSAKVGRAPQADEEWYCSSFCAWLRKVYAGEAHVSQMTEDV